MPSTTPSTVNGDTVGPADKVSNIRPYKFYQPEDETDLERSYRVQRTEAIEFNHDFWYKHNKNFFTVSHWIAGALIYELPHKEIKSLHMQKQKRRSAVQ